MTADNRPASTSLSGDERRASARELLASMKKARELKKAEPTKLLTVADYIDLVAENPALYELAHRRIYRMITSKPSRVIDPEKDARAKRIYGKDPVTVYDFFSGEFFGIERPLAKIVRFFHAASKGGEESRQVLYLMGPVGGGKSSLAASIARGLENFEGVYVLENDPTFGEPLHLIPRHLRLAFEERLGIKLDPRGEINPVVRDRLAREFNNEWERYPVVLKRPSLRGRRMIGVVPPVDPNNQDTSVLVGSEDISKLDRFSEGDPRILELNGAFNVGNRGMVEFIEVFKNQTDYLHTMITATQEKMVPAPGRHGNIFVDTAIIAHSNEAEWRKFKADHTNEAILDRIVIVKVPYNLRFSQEVEIYKKLLASTSFNSELNPHTLEVAAMFAVMSRLQPHAKCDSILTKMRLYDGEEIHEKGSTKPIDVNEIRQAAKDEGMTGISTRFVMKALDDALTALGEGKSLHPIAVREQLIKKVEEAELSEDTRKVYLEYLKDHLHKRYLELLEKDITKAYIHSFKEQAEALFQNYLDHAEAYTLQSKVRDELTQEDLSPDEAFMKSIEEQIGILGDAAKGFRQQVTSYMGATLRKGAKVSFESYKPLREAIERKLMNSVKELARIITKARTRDKEQGEKYEQMVENMLGLGYKPDALDTILKYAANHLWRD